MKRLLCIVGSLDKGGAETFLMKLYRNIDRNQYQFDFCVMNEIKGMYEREILELGGMIFHIAVKSKAPVRCFFEIKNIVKKYNYRSVMRINEHSISTLDLIAAKMGGSEKLIMRSSNANSSSKYARVLHRCCRFMAIRIPDIKIAPSTEAAVYTFGKHALENGDVRLLHNCIPIDEFIFCRKKRDLKRLELNITNKLVCGHIGRFAEQKNHKFLINVFCDIRELIDNAVLLLVGDGELKDSIKLYAKELHVESDIIFLGNRSDIPDLLMAMDIQIFPSLFEGMPNTIIEAQGSGLPCLISDSITKEANITGLVEYMSLKASSKEWADKCVEILKKSVERRDTREDFIREKYDIESVVKEFIDLIFNEKE